MLPLVMTNIFYFFFVNDIAVVNLFLSILYENQLGTLEANIVKHIFVSDFKILINKYINNIIKHIE